MANRENRPSKFAAPTSSRSTARRGGSTSAGLKPVYDYQEGTANEGSPVLVGFEDTTPSWQRFLRGVAGIEGPDVGGLNAQLALGREQSDRTFTQAKELEGIRSTADLTKVREESKLRREEKDLDSINAIKLAQEKARLDLRKAVLDNDLKAKDDAENHLRSLAADEAKTINTILQQAGVLPEHREQAAPILLEKAKAKAQSDIEASKAASVDSRVKQGVSQSQLDAIGGPEGTKIPRTTAMSSVTSPMLAPEVKNKKDSLTVLNEGETGFSGGFGNYPTTVYSPAQRGKPGVLGQPGTPPVDPSVRTMKDPDAIRAELDALRSAAASSRYPVSSNPAAAGQFWDAGNQGVVAGRVAPQTTTAVAPQATGLIPSFKRLGNLIPSLQEVSLAGEYAVRAGEDFLETPAIGSPEAAARARKRALRDQELYRHFNEPRIQPQASPIPVTQPATPVAPQRTTSNNQVIFDILNQILR